MTEAVGTRSTIELSSTSRVCCVRPVVAGTRGMGVIWDTHGIDRGIADTIDALPRLMVEGALSRKAQRAPAKFDIDRELARVPKAVTPEVQERIAREIAV